MYKYIIFLTLTISLSACVKEQCNETYTVSGQIMDGTTGKVAKNLPLELILSKQDMINPHLETLATGKTDSTGRFNLNYKCTNISGGSIKLTSQFFVFHDIPVNKDHDKIYYLSSKGKVRVILKTENPLELNNDTFFIARKKYLGNSTNKEKIIDTFVKTINGEYEIIQSPPPSITIFFGRGSKNFVINPDSDWFIPPTNLKSFKVTGDPVIDEVVINY